MITTVLFDIGGTLLTVQNSPALRTDFAKRLKARLALYGIEIPCDDETFGILLHDNGELYKHYVETALHELPGGRIWNEFMLKDFGIGEEKLAPIAEELSFLYDYNRVINLRRPYVKETMDELAGMGLKLGIITNVMSTSFAPHILREYGIDRQMDVLVMSSEAGCRKPDPAIFRYTMDKVGCTKEECCYVGDTISRDVLGSRRAELGLIIQIKNPAVSHRDKAFIGRPDCPQPDFLIEELNEIPDIIRRVNARA